MRDFLLPLASAFAAWLVFWLVATAPFYYSLWRQRLKERK